ncbi:MAG: tetratricopeptide repeat protein, partial [Limisphaerales bacterium]
MITLKKIAAMRYALTAMLAFCLCLPLMGGDAAKKLKKKHEEMLALAEAGNADAQYDLGLIYANGIVTLEGEPRNWDKEAVKWYRRAAEQGYGSAQFGLGFMYSTGRGVLENYLTGYAWMIIAQANGVKLVSDQKLALAKKMTPEQIAKAQELSKEMVKKN